MSQPTGLEIGASGAFWLLDVAYAGHTFRFATADLEVEDASGNRYAYSGQLDPDQLYSREFTLFSDSSAQDPLSFELLFPVDISELRSRGHDPATATGTLYLFTPGTPDLPRTVEDRVRVFEGRCREPLYGDLHQPMAFSLEATPLEDRGLYPPISHRIDASTWPDAPEDSQGRPYPLVFGSPGLLVDDTGAEVLVSGSPAYLLADPGSSAELESINLLIAGHWVQEGTVQVRNVAESPIDTSTRTVLNTLDALGQRVAVVRLDGTGSGGDLVADLAGRYTIAWSGAGGLLRENSSGQPLTGAGEIALQFLKWSTLPIDYGRMQVAADFLNTFKLSGYLNEQVVPAEWVESQLLKDLLPASLVSTPEGVALLPWVPDVASEDAWVHLEEGLNCWREAETRIQSGQLRVVNESSMEFGVDCDTGKYRLATSLSGDLAGPTSSSSHHCRVSFARYGRQAEEPLRSLVITEMTTANQVLLWRTRAFATPPETIEYLVSVELLSKLEPGRPVRLTSQALHRYQVRATVSRVAMVANGVMVELLLHEDLAAVKVWDSPYWGEDTATVWGS